jgi:potassium-transporting ATPase KdpC subunit
MSTKGSDHSNKFGRNLRPIVVLGIISMLLCGLAFPLVVTGVSQALFPTQAGGSLVHLGNRTVGSYYIDNGFTLPVFFHARNESDPLNASASGVDPDITLSEALAQIPRIHNATGIGVQSLNSIVTSHEEGTFWIFGDPYVNVLVLNIALIQSNSTVYSGFPKQP